MISEVGETLKCVDCHAESVFTETERAWYEARNLSVPRRCGPCRKSRRQLRPREHEFVGTVCGLRADHGFIQTDRGTFFFRLDDTEELLTDGSRVTFLPGTHHTGPNPRAWRVKLARV
jgi:hypothetical protein